MLSVTNGFKRQLNNDHRNYVIELRNFTLGNGTILPTITNEQIWDGGVSYSEATSDTSKFNIGSAIIGSCKIVLDNIRENFSQYDFFNATFDLFIGLTWTDTTSHTEIIKRGHYTVDSASYNGSLITLSCLDNMWKFDKPYSDLNISYPISARNLITAICLNVGMTLNTPSFPNYSTQILQAPKNDVNCREVLQYVAQICGCYCKVNVNGDLTLGWYDVARRGTLVDTDGGTYNTTTTPYSDGANVNGGTFAYNDGASLNGGLFTDAYEIAYLSSNTQMEVGTDDIAITGIRVYSNEKDAEYDITVGSEGYVLEIAENPFITTANYTSIASQIYNQCNGLVIRTFTATSLSDISIEAGDICYICDFRGNRFISYITNLSFTSGAYENFSCGAESPQKALSTRYSNDVQTYVQAQRAANEMIGVYDQAVQRMNMLANNMMGCYYAEKTDANGGVICYSSNKPFTYDSQGNLTGCTNNSTVWKRNDQGFFISSSGGTNLDTRVYASGIDSSGNVTAQSLATIGLSADWIIAGTISADRIEGGTLSIGGANYSKSIIEITDIFNDLAGRIDNNGVFIKSTTNSWKSDLYPYVHIKGDGIRSRDAGRIEFGACPQNGETDTIESVQIGYIGTTYSGSSGLSSLTIDSYGGNLRLMSDSYIDMDCEDINIGGATGSTVTLQTDELDLEFIQRIRVSSHDPDAYAYSGLVSVNGGVLEVKNGLICNLY